MNLTNTERESFVKRYWYQTIAVIIFCIILGGYIQLEFTEGDVVVKKITMIVDGAPTAVDSYNFVYEYKWAEIVTNFLYSLSMALAISMFILKVIQEDEDKIREERAIKREKKHKKEIAENVFKGVFDRLLPQEIFNVLQDDIIKADVIRKNIRWVYDFEIDSKNNAIKLKRNVTYEVHNLTNSDHVEDFSYTFSKTAYTSTEIQSLKWHDKEDKEATSVYYETKEKVENHLEHDPGENMDKVFTTIEIPPNKARLINFVSLEEHTTGIEFVRDTHFNGACAIGWGLHVNFPKGYDFTIMSLFPGEVQTIIDDEGKKVYEYEGGMLKGQGIEFVLCKNV